MNLNNVLQPALFIVVLLAAAVPVSRYLSRVMDGSSRVVKLGGPVERLLYRLPGGDPEQGMGWGDYRISTLAFNLLGVAFLYVLLRVQGLLPGNPQQFSAMTVDGAFNTAISFVTNTNWQDYSGEQAVSYLTQMLALALQNFFSAATGIVVVIALIRGFARHTVKGIGNAWVDLTRVTMWILLPLSFVYAIFLVQQGSIQNFDGYKDVKTMEVV